MTKKVKIGTIKVTRKVTVTQHIEARQSFHQDYSYEPIVSSSVDKYSLPADSNNVQKEIKKLETSVKKASRPTKLPSGVYSHDVETLYSEFEKRRKNDSQDEDDMYDVFISHASEDKKDFVDPLVEALQNEGIRVWYDTLEMQWGRSLREQIDNGIKRSKFAILVLSKHFFEKKWPQRELDGILAKQDITGACPLPIWYNLSYEDVYQFSPTLAGVFSLPTDTNSIEDICKALKLQLGKEEIKWERS